MRNLTLIIPYLSQNLNQSVSLPALKKLLARAKVHKFSNQSHEAFLLQQFDINPQNELPIAAIAGLAEHLPTQNNYWLRIDPVELRADLTTVYLLGNHHLNETHFDNTQMKTLFALDGLKFHAPHPLRWYLEIKEEPQIQTTPLSYVTGRSINQYLPTGEKQTYWRKLMTEIQMLMHTNAKGQANGVWLWGEGRLPQTPLKQWQKIWGSDVLLKGLAKLSGLSITPAVNTFAELVSNLANRGDYLIMLEQTNFNPEEWVNLETSWFAPLISALRTNKLTSLKLYIGNGSWYEITCKSIWYFWRRNKI